jgi:hypothetical protein
MAYRLTPPRAALILGLAALAPFVGSSLTFAYGPANLAGPALLALTVWSAVILGYLGGVRWGVELAGQPRTWALASSLSWTAVGWLILIVPLPTVGWQLILFLAAFLAKWLWDVLSRELPPWYRHLRTWATAGACVSLAVALEHALASGL